MKFKIVDVYSTEIFGGNPAGVVIIPEEDDFPQHTSMQKTAAELRYSETVFIKKISDKFQTVYFTPTDEVPLCGHATIGAFYALLSEGVIKKNQTYLCSTKCGELKIYVESENIFMDMAKPELFETLDERQSDELYGSFAVSSEGQGFVSGSTEYLLPRIAYSGLKDIMLPVKNEEELSKLSPDFSLISEISKRYSVVGVHAFSVNNSDGFIHARNFAPLVGIDEEAATGTSNGALTFYLHQNGIIKESSLNTIIQGEKMNRPSKIFTTIHTEKDSVNIRVGGSSVVIASRELFL